MAGGRSWQSVARDAQRALQVRARGPRHDAAATRVRSAPLHMGQAASAPRSLALERRAARRSAAERLAMSPPWPDGARAAISITLDNLGEAAELELGLRDASAPLGDHYSVTIALPIVLALLADAGLQATFFIEGINAEVYPDALRAVLEADHELAYHAWCHEDWSTLSAAAEVANLDRGLAALREIGVEIQGLRPPGGRLNAGSCELL